MKASIELPVVLPEILTWTDDEGINSPRSGRRHKSNHRSVNAFNVFMNPQWKQVDIERIILSDYPELEESLQFTASSSKSSTSSLVEDVGEHKSIEYHHVSFIITVFLFMLHLFLQFIISHSNHSFHGLTIIIF